MPDMQRLSDSMLSAAATVFGRLVELSAAAVPTRRDDHEGSIRTDGAELVALVDVPSLGAQVVVRFARGDVQKIVASMLGNESDGGEMGAMQLSIASETVSQIAAAMCEQLAQDIGASGEGIRAELCSDATLLPPPPFESYVGAIRLSEGLIPEVSIDFAAITLSRLSGAEPSEVAAGAGGQSAQSVTFDTLVPTPIKTVQAGQANLDLVHDVPLQVSAVLGRAAMPLREVVSLQAGSVFELDKGAVEPIDLYVNNILIARGEVVVVDDKYAVKISELNPQYA